jgi:hypothetical protein
MAREPEPPAGDEGVRLRAEASGSARVYQAGRDQHLHFEDGLRAVRRAGGAGAMSACPYPGLAAFSSTDAEWFFGRDRLTSDLTSLLAGLGDAGGPLMLVAPSGAGKSSLIQAGLMPAIRRGALPLAGSPDWPQVLFTPTAHPMRAAAASIAALGGAFAAAGTRADAGHLTEVVGHALRARSGQATEPAGTGPARIVIVVDQLEELFTLDSAESERREFIGWLWQLSRSDADGGPLAVVACGLRADFYGECASYPQLREALTASQVFVGPMSQFELRQAIRFPAQVAGLEIEDGLVELLLRDLGGEASGDASGDLDSGDSSGLGARDYDAGRLPFLAHALQATWQQRAGHVLTVAGYEATGGIPHAIATTAERCFKRLDPAARDEARAVFLRLIRISDNGEDARRPLSRQDLVQASANPDGVRSVLDAYTDARLLTQSQQTVQITHEALIRAWPRLRHWINEDRAGNLIRQELEDSAAAWTQRNRSADALHRARSWTRPAAGRARQAGPA